MLTRTLERGCRPSKFAVQNKEYGLRKTRKSKKNVSGHRRVLCGSQKGGQDMAKRRANGEGNRMVAGKGAIQQATIQLQGSALSKMFLVRPRQRSRRNLLGPVHIRKDVI